MATGWTRTNTSTYREFWQRGRPAVLSTPRAAADRTSAMFGEKVLTATPQIASYYTTVRHAALRCWTLACNGAIRLGGHQQWPRPTTWLQPDCTPADELHFTDARRQRLSAQLSAPHQQPTTRLPGGVITSGARRA